MKAFDLLIHGNLLSIATDGGFGGGAIEQGLPRETCPSCNQPLCCWDCDGSQGADESNKETDDNMISRVKYNTVLDTVESLLLAMACAGIDLNDPKYTTAVETTLDAAGNALG